MSCQFLFEEKKFNGQDKTGINFMPFMVDKNQQCNTEKYFQPHDNNNKVIIHGRELTNTKIILPKPLYIYQKLDNGNKVIRSKIEEVNLWTQNAQEIQQGQQLFEFVNLMEALHKPL